MTGQTALLGNGRLGRDGWRRGGHAEGRRGWGLNQLPPWCSYSSFRRHGRIGGLRCQPKSLVTDAQGTAQRESLQTISVSERLAPLGKMVAAELSEKLDTQVRLDWQELRASDHSGPGKSVWDAGLAVGWTWRKLPPYPACWWPNDGDVLEMRAVQAVRPDRWLPDMRCGVGCISAHHGHQRRKKCAAAIIGLAEGQTSYQLPNVD